MLGTTFVEMTIGALPAPPVGRGGLRQDYFGQTVNIAARVQSLSTSQEIHITGPVIDSPAAGGFQGKPVSVRRAMIANR